MSIEHSDRWSFRSAGDAAIVEILDGVRDPSTGDTEAIIHRMAAAPFDSRRRDLPRPLVSLIQQYDYALDEQPTELTHHWAKHVLGDGQWDLTTTEATYFDDIRRATSHPSAALFLQRRRTGRSRAILIVQTTDIVPLARLGPGHGPELVIVYSAEAGVIVSGYMTASSTDMTSSLGTIWLRR